MPYEFRLPDVGEGIAEAEIVRWLVQPGERVGLDDPLVEIETDKAVVEVPSPVAGVVISQGGRAGDTLQVGDVLAVLDAAGAAAATPAATPSIERINPSADGQTAGAAPARRPLA